MINALRAYQMDGLDWYKCIYCQNEVKVRTSPIAEQLTELDVLISLKRTKTHLSGVANMAKLPVNLRLVRHARLLGKKAFDDLMRLQESG